MNMEAMTLVVQEGDMLAFALAVESMDIFELNMLHDGLGYTTLLDYVLIRNNIPMTELLIRRNVNLNVESAWGETPLEHSIRYKLPDMLNLLVDAGVNLDWLNKNGFPMLHLAVHTHDKNIVAMLIESGVDVHAQDDNGWTALQWAVYHADIDICKILLDAGVSPDVPDIVGTTARDTAKTLEPEEQLLIERLL